MNRKLRDKPKGMYGHTTSQPIRQIRQEGVLRHHDGDVRELKVAYKVNFYCFKLYRDRFHFANFTKCKRTILKSNSLHSYPSSEREGKFVVARLSPPKKVKLGIFTS